MGLDIYIQAFDEQDNPAGSRVELRSRVLYHAMNEYLMSTKGESPESGEKIHFSKPEWTSQYFQSAFLGAVYQMYLEDDYEDSEIHELIQQLVTPLEGKEMAYVQYYFTC